MKTLQNFLTTLFAIALMSITLISLDSCRKADDVSPSASQQTSQSGGNVSALPISSYSNGEVSARGTLRREAGSYMLIGENASSFKLMSAELNLAEFINKTVDLKGYIINKTSSEGATTLLNVAWIKVIAEKPILSDYAANASINMTSQSGSNAAASMMDRSTTLHMITSKGIVRQERTSDNERGTSYLLMREDAAPFGLASSQVDLSAFVNKNVALKGYIISANSAEGRMTYLNVVSIQEIADKPSSDLATKTN